MTEASASLAETWDDFKIGPVVKEAISAMKWKTPTTIQRAAVNCILTGRDVAIESRTGTGKTAAYAIPLAQRSTTKRAKGEHLPFALVLVPSVELCDQTTSAIEQLCRFVKPRPKIINMCSGAEAAISASAPVPTLDEKTVADVIVSTPSTIAKGLLQGQIHPKVMASLRVLVIDEADILTSTRSMSAIRAHLPSTIQTVLLSATLNENVATLKGQLMHNPTSIRVSQEEEEAALERRKAESTIGVLDNTVSMELKAPKNSTVLKQYYLVSNEHYTPHTLLYSLFRLNLLQGKTLIFVEDEQDTYKLQHFCEQVGISTIVYDTSLPLNSRLDLLRRFQKNTAGTLICTDTTLEKAERTARQTNAAAAADGTEPPKTKSSSIMSSAGIQEEEDDAAEDTMAGLGRGIDFNQVRNVILFDGVRNATALNFGQYSHRIGRTGRAGQVGTSIVIFTPYQSREVSGPLKDYCRNRGEDLRPFKKLDRTKAAALQYRVDSALAIVTRNASRKLRVATVASEMAKSAYLNSHLGGSDSSVLKRIVGRVQHKVKTDKELTEIPAYMKIEADTAEDYQKRVKSRNQLTRQNVFESITKKRERDDPMAKVVQKVRRTEKTKSAAAASAGRGASSRKEKTGGATKRNGGGRPGGQTKRRKA